MQNFGSPIRTRHMQLVELRLAINLPVYLRDQYVTRGRKLAEIATDLDVDTGTVSRWMAHFGIPTRRSAA